MIADIEMPRLSDPMEEGTILECRKGAGDPTKRIDMSHCVAARSRWKASESSGFVPSFNDMVGPACATALRAHPRRAVALAEDVRAGITPPQSIEAALACDHRFPTAAEGAAFPAAFSEALTQPAAPAGVSPGRH